MSLTSLTARLLAALAVPLLWCGAATAQQAVRPPNVLMLLVDDLRPEIGAYGSERAITPHMDGFAQRSVLFQRAYTQQAVCAPSRITMLSGLRPDSTRIYNLEQPLRSRLPDVVTLPQLFRENGYASISIGKIYHHADDDPQGWSLAPIKPQGEWKGRGYLHPASIRAVEAFEAANPGSGGRGPSYEAAAVHDTAYQDGKIANRAIEQLRRLRDEPFFLAVGFAKPHLPFNAPQRYWDLYPRESIRLPDNYFRPQGVTRFSLANFGELRNYTDMPRQGPVPDDQARELIRGYLATTSYVDAQIGRVLAELQRLGLDDNTIVVLWGDHGFKLGEHAEWVKHSNFEIDTRVPLMVRAPGMATGGRVSPALVEAVDIYPTVADLAGLSAPRYLQGTSFAPLLRDPARAWKTAAFSQYPRRDVMGRSIRTDRYHYVEWQSDPGGEVLARELYDHQTDPQENVNVADGPGNADVVARLSAMLAAGWRAARPPAP